MSANTQAKIQRVLLMRYNLPGNVRELENAVERAVLLTEGPQLSSQDLREQGAPELRGSERA